MSWIKHLRERWHNWVGDHDMERAIRRHLTTDGYFGGTAKLRNVRLVAVQRPGWLQIFRFEATARVDRSNANADEPAPDAEYHELFGLVREDARKDQSSVRVFRNNADRGELFKQWSEDLICLRGAQGLSPNA
ncbi:hypothetical protein [Planctomycetes bacterium K23_9]|uniref:Uncharacterized protein n=1 Tax=Stieleria marina TaxID=1930275 RepID=A0A517NQI4_9BACT|nr:hypothetical protein K239x_13330 [Planctomycetes bacterium K23_9]